MPTALHEFPDAVLADQLADDVVRRRRRAGDAQQRIDVAEIVARHRELHVGAGPLEGIHHRALGLELGGAEGDVDVQRIGLVGVAQHHDRAADEVDRQRLAVELALELQFGLRLGAGLAGRRRNGAVEVELALGIAEGELALGDLEMADHRRLEAVVRLDRLLGRGGGRRRFAEVPVHLVVVALLDHQLGLEQHQGRQHQLAAQQRPQADVEVDPLGLEHVGLLGPLGIGELDVAQMDVRRPAPVDRQIADFGLAARQRAGLAGDARAEIVGRYVEIGRPDRHGDQTHQDAERPAEDAKESCHPGRTTRRCDGSIPTRRAVTPATSGRWRW